MALIQCGECDKQISSFSDHCVYCGYPVVGFDRAIEEFRSAKLNEISNGAAGHGIEGARVVVHLFPREALFTDKAYGIIGISAYISRSLHLLFGGAVEPQFDSNGILLLQNSFDRRQPLASLELHRNGMVEAVDSLFFGTHKNVSYFQIDLFSDRIVAACNELLQIYKLVGVTGPFVLLISFLGIKDHTVSSKAVHFPGKRAVQTGSLLRKVQFMNTAAIEKNDMRPLYEQLWNTFGYMRVRNTVKQSNVKA
jgi:uncharacterized membrane protein YuzA (DUF378 family)